MIWRSKDPTADHFVKFGHQEARIAALEADFLAISKGMLACLTGFSAGSARHLADTLSAIIENREIRK